MSDELARKRFTEFTERTDRIEPEPSSTISGRP